MATGLTLSGVQKSGQPRTPLSPLLPAAPWQPLAPQQSRAARTQGHILGKGGGGAGGDAPASPHLQHHGVPPWNCAFSDPTGELTSGPAPEWASSFQMPMTLGVLYKRPSALWCGSFGKQSHDPHHYHCSLSTHQVPGPVLNT